MSSYKNVNIYSYETKINLIQREEKHTKLMGSHKNMLN